LTKVQRTVCAVAVATGLTVLLFATRRWADSTDNFAGWLVWQYGMHVVPFGIIGAAVGMLARNLKSKFDSKESQEFKPQRRKSDSPDYLTVDKRRIYRVASVKSLIVSMIGIPLMVWLLAALRAFPPDGSALGLLGLVCVFAVATFAVIFSPIVFGVRADEKTNKDNYDWRDSPGDRFRDGLLFFNMSAFFAAFVGIAIFA